jgi:hypothetical protein
MKIALIFTIDWDDEKHEHIIKSILPATDETVSGLSNEWPYVTHHIFDFSAHDFAGWVAQGMREVPLHCVIMNDPCPGIGFDAFWTRGEAENLALEWLYGWDETCDLDENCDGSAWGLLGEEHNPYEVPCFEVVVAGNQLAAYTHGERIADAFLVEASIPLSILQEAIAIGENQPELIAKIRERS